MPKNVLIVLTMFATSCLPLVAQGNSCQQYTTWYLSGNAGSGGQPAFWPSPNGNQFMEQLQSQYGGTGPSCSAVWEGVPGVWGGWGGVCSSVGWTCAPPAPPVGGCSSTCVAGEPISLSDGNTFIEQTDVRIPGLGGGLVLTRTWNSLQLVSGNLFPGWLTNFDEQVFPGGDGTMKYARADGSIWSFAYIAPQGGPGAFQLIAPANGHATLTELTQQNIPVGWQITFQNGEQRTFGIYPGFISQCDTGPINSAQLNGISDRNGNGVQLNYTNSGQQCAAQYLTSVVDAAGRHLYFTYASGHLTNVTSDTGTGINITYTYSTSPSGSTVLSRVTQSDNTFVTYTYDFYNNIVSVNDMNGKVLESHAYDTLRRGLSSSRANGVDALTISFP
jgi:hypothetical protein